DDSEFEDRLHNGAHAGPRAGLVAAEQRPDARNPGDIGGEAIPVPIPNTEVKLSSAEDTERAAFRENRSSPGFCVFRFQLSAGDGALPATATRPGGRRRSVWS